MYSMSNGLSVMCAIIANMSGRLSYIIITCEISAETEPKWPYRAVHMAWCMAHGGVHGWLKSWAALISDITSVIASRSVGQWFIRN